MVWARAANGEWAVAGADAGAVLPGKRRSAVQQLTWEALVRADCKGLECADPWAQCLDRVAWRTTCGRKHRNGQ